MSSAIAKQKQSTNKRTDDKIDKNSKPDNYQSVIIHYANKAFESEKSCDKCDGTDSTDSTQDLRYLKEYSQWVSQMHCIL